MASCALSIVLRRTWWLITLTKPLQGILFYKLRDQVMNIDSSSSYHSSQRSVLTGEDLEQTNPDIDLKEQQVTQPSDVRRRSYRDVVVDATSFSNGKHHPASGSADHPATGCAELCAELTLYVLLYYAIVYCR